MTQALDAVGGVMGGTHHYEVLLGPVGAADAELRFRLYCSSPSRETHDQYCTEEERIVVIAVPAGTQVAEGGAAREGRYAPEKESGDA